MLQIYSHMRALRTSVSQSFMKQLLESNTKRTFAPVSSTAQLQIKQNHHAANLTTPVKTLSPLLSRCVHHSVVLNSQTRYPLNIPRTLVPSPSRLKPKPEPAEDLIDEASLRLLDQLYDADSVQGILDIYEEQQGMFSEVHSARALWCLSQVSAAGRSHPVTDGGDLPAEIGPTDLVQMDGFRDLCSRVLQDSPHMSNEHFLPMLEGIQKLNIPDSSELVQTLLEQCKHRLNTFSTNELALLAAILNRMPQSNFLAAVLLDGIALKVPDHIENTNQMLAVVRFLKAVGKKLSFVDQKLLVNRLLAIFSVGSDVSPELVVQSLKAISGIRGLTQTYCRLALEYLGDKLDDLHRSDMVSILIAANQLRCYNEEFFQVFGDHVVQMISNSSEPRDAWTLNQLSHICRVYTKVNHFHLQLFDAVAEFVITSKQQCTLVTLTNIVHPFGKFAYLPPNGSQFLDFATDICSKVDLETEQLWACVSMATYLVWCDRYPEQMVDFILKKFTGDIPLDDLSTLHNLRMMYQAMSIRGYTSKLPEFQKVIASIPESHGQRRLSPKVERMYKKAKTQTKQALNRIIGNHDVLENVDAGLGYTIDFVLKQGEKKQALVLQDAYCYTVNDPHHALVGNRQMQQYLETNGYQVIWLQVEDVDSLISAEDREEFVRNRIGSGDAL